MLGSADEVCKATASTCTIEQGSLDRAFSCDSMACHSRFHCLDIVLANVLGASKRQQQHPPAPVKPCAVQEAVAAKLREVHVRCGSEGDSGLTSVQMLASLEARLEELLAASALLTPEAVLAGQKARENERRKVGKIGLFSHCCCQLQVANWCKLMETRIAPYLTC